MDLRCGVGVLRRLGQLAGFRDELYRCLTTRSDALFEMVGRCGQCGSRRAAGHTPGVLKNSPQVTPDVEKGRSAIRDTGPDLLFLWSG
jgi:hypothetical protein